jgi:hypothetical protein
VRIMVWRCMRMLHAKRRMQCVRAFTQQCQHTRTRTRTHTHTHTHTHTRP